jgi:flavodoxin
MRSLIVYESMYGNTRHIAEEISRGLSTAGADSTGDAAVVVAAHDVAGVTAPHRDQSPQH